MPKALPAAGLLLALAPLQACGPRETPEAARARVNKAFLEDQIVGLERLVARAERGEVETTDQVAIGVDEGVARQILNGSLPQEVPLGAGVKVRIEKAEPIFRGTIAGLVFRARATSEQLVDAYAELELAGTLPTLAFEGERLRAHVSLEHFAVLKASAGPLAQTVVERLVRENLKTLEDAIPPFEVPVRLEQSVHVAGLRAGPVSTKGGRLPIKLTVSEVLNLKQRMWVLIDVQAGPWEPDAQAPEREEP